MTESKKQLFLSSLQTGDIILSYNIDNALSKFIAAVTDSKWSHTMLYIGFGSVVESIIGGVQISPIKKYFDGKHNLIALRLKADMATRKELARNVTRYLGKKYGYLQLLWYLFLRIIHRSENPRAQKDLQPNAMVCSEAVARALKDLGYEVKPGFKPQGVEPVDFLESDLFTVVSRYIVEE